MADQRVVLHRITPDSGGAPVDSATTGPDGEFAFPLPARDAASGETSPGPSGGPVFLVTARYSGVLYFGPAVHSDEAAGSYRVEVYPVERAAGRAGPAIRSRTLVLAPADGGVRVMDVVVARGEPGRTLAGPAADGGAAGPQGPGGGGDAVPSPDSAGGGRPDEGEAWWTVGLPRAARDVRVLPGAVDPAEVAFAPGEARISAVVPPSGRRLVIGYRVPEGSPLEVVLRHPTGRVEVLARRGAGPVRVEGARRADSVRMRGERLARFRLEGREPGDTLRVRLGGAGGDAHRALGWIAVAAGVLLAGAAAWTWRRRAGGRPETGGGRA